MIKGINLIHLWMIGVTCFLTGVIASDIGEVIPEPREPISWTDVFLIAVFFLAPYVLGYVARGEDDKKERP